MKKPLFSLVCLLGVFLAPLVFAGGGAVKTMANILSHLEHYPSDAEKKDLQAIVADKASTSNEKVIAQAMLGLQHKAADADKPKLKAIGADAAATAPEKTLAEIILNLAHSPSASDKEKLAGLMK